MTVREALVEPCNWGIAVGGCTDCAWFWDLAIKRGWYSKRLGRWTRKGLAVVGFASFAQPTKDQIVALYESMKKERKTKAEQEALGL